MHVKFHFISFFKWNIIKERKKVLERYVITMIWSGFASRIHIYIMMDPTPAKCFGTGRNRIRNTAFNI